MKRLHSIDILRALAILSMIQVHFVENLSPWKADYATLYDIADIVGSFAAPTFTSLVGLSLYFSLEKQRSQGRPHSKIATRTFKRGMAVFITGLIFAIMIWLPEQIFDWDILTLIGASILILYPLRKLPPVVLIAFSVVILLVSPLLRVASAYPAYWPYPAKYVYDFTPKDILLGFFVNGYFPLFPWLIYPLVGMAVGKRLSEIDNWKLPAIGISLLVLAGIGTSLNQR